MNAAASWDGVYLIVGWTLAGAAIALGLWAVFWDRSRGRRRCPKCWYDMAGSPGLRCPECGREARGERKLLRTRRRWRWALLAAIVGVGAYAVGSVPRYRDGGWVALVPSSVLVYIAPAGVVNQGWMAFPTTAGPAMGGAPPARLPTQFLSNAAPGKASDLLSAAAWQRLQSRKLARWQSQVFVRRHLSQTKRDLTKEIAWPVRWPIGEAIPMVARRWNFSNLTTVVRDRNGKWVSSAALWLPACMAAAESVPVEIGLETTRLVYSTRLRLPIEISGTRDTLLDRVDSAQATELVQKALNPVLSNSAGQSVVIMHDRTEQAPWDSIDFGVCYTFEIRIGTEVIGTGSAVAEWGRAVWKDWEELSVKWVGDGRSCLPGEPATITVRGDVTTATSEYIHWPFDKGNAACWAGEFTMPLELRPHPGEAAK